MREEKEDTGQRVPRGEHVARGVFPEGAAKPTEGRPVRDLAAVGEDAPGPPVRDVHGLRRDP